MILFVDTRRSNMRVSLFNYRGDKVKDITTRRFGLLKKQRVYKDYFVILLRTFLRQVKIKRYKEQDFILKFKGIFRKRWASYLVRNFLKSRRIKFVIKYVRIIKVPHNGCRVQKKRR